MDSLNIKNTYQTFIMEFLTKNGLSIAIALAGIIATYSINTALYGYRLTALETRQDRQEQLVQILQDGDTETRVALARIQTDLEYIKAQLNRINN